VSLPGLERLAESVADHNGLHLPGVLDAKPRWYKEWYHVCVLGPDVELILNLNLAGDLRPGADPKEARARAVLLVRTGAWQGTVETVPLRDVTARAGEVRLVLGHHELAFEDGRFRISTALLDQPLSARLVLSPVARPLLARSETRVGEGTINWLVLPRLEAEGTIVVGGRVHRLARSPAYHDHNWGRWLWGHDFAWEWGFGLPQDPANPWSCVFDLTTNRARTEALERTFAVWKGGSLRRLFVGRDIEVEKRGFLRARPLKFPAVMRLLSPEASTDVPQSFVVKARSGRDHLELAFEAESACQVLIPNELELDLTLITEVSGRVHLSGEVREERVELAGRGIFEFLSTTA
jgi:hypothetical protein